MTIAHEAPRSRVGKGVPFDDGVRYSEQQRGKGSELTQNWAGMARGLGPLAAC